MMKSLGQVLCSDNTSARVLTLARPASLNALTLKMVRELYDYYITNPHRSPKAVYILRGEGIRSFCAGGDAFALSGELSINEHREYFAKIYALYHHIATQRELRKEWNVTHCKRRSNKEMSLCNFSTNVALWRGHVCGNGVGLSLHGSHRVACESTELSMPEVKFGLLPDAASCWKFARLPLTGLGAYLALTGNTIKGADALHAGLATHYIDTSHMRELQKDLYEVQGPEEVEECLASHAAAVPPFLLALHSRTLHYAFDVNTDTTLPGIMERLKEDGSPFARMALDSLRDNCPSAMVTALEMLKCHRHIENIHTALSFDAMVIKRMCSLNVFRRGVEYALRRTRSDPEWPEPDINHVNVEEIKRNLDSILNEVITQNNNNGNSTKNSDVIRQVELEEKDECASKDDSSISKRDNNDSTNELQEELLSSAEEETHTPQSENKAQAKSAEEVAIVIDKVHIASSSKEAQEAEKLTIAEQQETLPLSEPNSVSESENTRHGASPTIIQSVV